MKVTEEHILTLTFYIMISAGPEVSFLLCCLNLTKGKKKRGGGVIGLRKLLPT